MGHGAVVVVGEEDQPVFGDGALVEAFALGDAGDWVEVVAHDPGGVEVGAGGDEVGDVAGVPLGSGVGGGLDVDSHELGGVAGEEFDRDSGDDLGVGTNAFGGEQGHLTGLDERIVVGGEIADAVAVELEMTVGDLAGVGEVAGVGEGGGDGAIGVEGGVPATVVEVEVGIDDNVDLLGVDTGGGERGGEEFLIAVDLTHLGGLLVADAGLDEDGVVSGADDGGVESQEDAVLVVGGGAFLPECLGDDTEHGTAVEPVYAIGADGEFVVSEVGTCAYECVACRGGGGGVKGVDCIHGGPSPLA